ncbi:MAG: hypothetical protein HQL19_08800, partial [Candidatus Omnitrophica bacterium]|nr:hypothetical protein [Candidatus Omnitrophota bacterium]
VYKTNLLVKMLCLVANKAATLDPSGIGMDMEANKPGWYDSLNGLPGLLGSSIAETLELKRLALFMLDTFDQLSVNGSEPVLIFEELALFIEELKGILDEKIDALDYWKKSNTAKEEYREKVRLGICGVEREMALCDVRRFLEAIVRKVNAGLQKAKGPDGLFPTYYYYKVTKYEAVDGVPPSKEGPRVRPLLFERHEMPLFLEGFVHGLRCEKDSVLARGLHEKVRKSPLYDRALGMYKLNADITSETEEVGRTRVFPRGWLENESIWLHMEYKYILELLRRGLYEEFYAALSTCCVAFMPPKRYGRSILENSSFLVSSAHHDQELHGQGFVARLSGSTAEFIHIWMVMNAGLSPFVMKGKNEVELALRPALKAEFFTKEASRPEVVRDGKAFSVALAANTYAFMFMGRTLVVYHNSKRKDTFGAKGAKAVRTELVYAGTKKAHVVSGATIPCAQARDVRDGKVERIDIYLE